MWVTGPITYRRLRTIDFFLSNFFMACLFALRVFAGNILRGNRRRNILFRFDIWPRIQTRALRLISQRIILWRLSRPSIRLNLNHQLFQIWQHLYHSFQSQILSRLSPLNVMNRSILGTTLRSKIVLEIYSQVWLQRQTKSASIQNLIVKAFKTGFIAAAPKR